MRSFLEIYVSDCFIRGRIDNFNIIANFCLFFSFKSFLSSKLFLNNYNFLNASKRSNKKNVFFKECFEQNYKSNQSFRNRVDDKSFNDERLEKYLDEFKKAKALDKKCVDSFIQSIQNIFPYLLLMLRLSIL